MEPTLAIKKSEYEQKVGFIAGYGRGEEAGETPWTSKQSYIISECVKGGLRRFYHSGFKWSFLKPFLELTLPDGENVLAMPDDFGGIETSIVVTHDDISSGPPVNIVNPALIDQMFANSTNATGKPEVASIRIPKGTDGKRGQRCELYIYPVADDDYTLRFRYWVNPNNLDGNHPYAYGGAEHSETIMQSCLMTLEEQFNNIMGGPHAVAFANHLKASMEMDARKNPLVCGPNLDRSDDVVELWPRRYSSVTINGVAYGE